MANLVVCSDGTWMTEKKFDATGSRVSNVVRLHGAVAPMDAGGIRQKTYYHSGVGTEGGWFERLRGGAMGRGLDQRIKSAYKWLATTYQEGDRVFLFGFSRGAYTVRSLAGMIIKCGLLDAEATNMSSRETWAAVDQIYEIYRGTRRDFGGLKFFNCEPGRLPTATTGVHFLGVWDTVGSLGIPDELAFLNLFDKLEKRAFHDTELSEHVANARHAVSIDERRQTFAPTLWTDIAHRGDSVKQLWFSGVHGDIGGGQPNPELSDTTLNWMLNEAMGCGLAFKDSVVEQIRPDDHHGYIHESMKGVFRSLKSRPRPVPSFTVEQPMFHPSAIRRMMDPPIRQPDYWIHRDWFDRDHAPRDRLEIGESKTLDIYAAEKWNPTGVYMKPGEVYGFAAEGEWLDAGILCNPNGPVQGRFQAGQLFLMGGTALGKLEGVIRRFRKNASPDVWFSRRVEEFPWFSLVGVVANGAGTTEASGLVEHDTILIGDGNNVKHLGHPDSRGSFPTKPGYLYCFANDAWQAYGNNRGSVRLRITRTA